MAGVEPPGLQLDNDSEDGDGNASDNDGQGACSVPILSQPTNSDPCFRCGKRVYPVEKLDIGVLFHRRCFRCRVCSLQLSLKTFHWFHGNDQDIFCSVHLPKLVGTIDQQSMGIKSALNAPRRAGAPNEQIRGSVHNPGWQYDADALEFAHHRQLVSRGKRKRSMGTYKEFERVGVFDAQSELEEKQKAEEDRLYHKLKQDREIKIQKMEEQLRLERDKTVKRVSNEFSVDAGMADNSGTIAHDWESEKEKIESEYREKREERMRRLLASLSVEERTSVAQLIDKHSQEMLLMIAERLMTIQEEKESSTLTSEEDGVLDLSQPPEIIPPEAKKTELFTTPTVFNKLDTNTLRVTKKHHSTFTGLVKDLTKDCTSDLEKARALFLWIALKDLNKLDMIEAAHPDSPLGLLRGIKSGSESYHDLFKRLCSYAGLFCEIIQGYSKGAGYKAGMRLDGEKFRNSWTAVCIDGSWQFINSNWGARHVKGHTKRYLEDPSELHYKCDEFYFITEPEYHIYQHFPDDPKWQLLECPISIKDFVSLPVVKSPFFTLGLVFPIHYDSVIQTIDGVVEIEIQAVKLTEFAYSLDPKDKSVDHKSIEGRVYARCVNQKVTFTVAPPYVGRFYLTIYAKEDWLSESFQSACSFQIRCTAKDKVLNVSYPKVPLFGQTCNIEAYGLIAKSHTDPFIEFKGNDIYLEFDLARDCSLSASLEFYAAGQVDKCEDSRKGVFLHYKSKDEAVFCVRCHKKGMYVLSILNYEESASKNTNCVFRYLLQATSPATNQQHLPRACHRWLDCRLLSPADGTLPRDTKVIFKLHAPLAQDVAVLIEDVWFHLKKTRDDLWEGSVYTGKKPNVKAKVYGKLHKEKSRFSPLVEFVVT